MVFEVFEGFQVFKVSVEVPRSWGNLGWEGRFLKNSQGDSKASRFLGYGGTADSE